MLTNYVKRVLSFALALIMVLGMLPLEVLAAGEPHDHSNGTCAVVESLREIAAEVVQICGLRADMTDEEVLDAFFVLDDDQIELVLNHFETGEELAEDLTEEEAALLSEEENATLAMRLYDLLTEIYGQTTYAVGENYEPTDGIFVTSSDATNFTYADGAITVTATGTNSSGCGSSNESATANITITNKTGNNIVLKFDVETTLDGGSCTIDSKTASTSATLYMNAGTTKSIVLKSAAGNKTATLKMSNFSVEQMAEAHKITFQFDSALGSVTVAGTEVAPDDVVDVSPASGTELVATPAEDYVFFGWYDDTNKELLDYNATYSFKPTADITVKPAFIPSDSAIFTVGSSKFYDLNEADAFAKNGSTKTIVLSNNGKLYAGDYTISSGVTLLIPANSDNKVQTTSPDKTYSGPPSKSSLAPYRTLIIADGANIEVNGKVSVSGGMLYFAGGSKQGSGTPTGTYGYVKMENGSSITVNSGGGLYCYGYINVTDPHYNEATDVDKLGKVLIKSGAEVYESFLFDDFRGGTQMDLLVDGGSQSGYGVFPINTYSVQNVMVPMTLEAGATEYGYAGVTVSSILAQGTSLKYIASDNAMFNLTGGTVTKRYVHSTDRLEIEFNASQPTDSVNISSISMSIATYKIDSSNYDLPIYGNMTIRINGGNINLHQDVALLPGVEVYISKDASCNMSEGISMFVYDSDQWGTYCGATNQKMYAVYYVPDRIATLNESNLKDAYFEVAGKVKSSGNVFTTAGGAAIVGVEGATVSVVAADESIAHYQMIQGSSPSSNTEFVSIDKTTVRLKNADGTYTDPSRINPDKGVVYTYTNGVWVADCPGDGTCTLVEGPACQPGACKYCDYTDSSNVVGHTPGAAATCTTAQTCTVCGDVLVEALNHSEETVPGKAATCYATGLTDGVKCNREGCGVTIKEQEPIEKLAHTWSTAGTQTKDPTCTETGVVQHYCTVCHEAGYEALDDRTIPALGHNNVTAFAKQDATCTEPGTKAYFYCAECASYYETSKTEDNKELDGKIEDIDTWKVIPANGHTVVDHAAVAAKCDAYGTNAYYSCSVCNKNYTTKTVEGDKVVLSGEIDNVTTWLDTLGQGKVEKLPHTIESVEKVDSTCVETGTEAGTKCSVCGFVESGCDEIHKKAHYSDGESLGYGATCTADGREDYYKCSSACGLFFKDAECTEQIGDATATTEWYTNGEGKIEALGHHLVLVPEVPKTCNSAGTKAHYKCMAVEGCTDHENCDRVVCGALFSAEDQTTPVTADDLIIAAGHTPADPVRENDTELTYDLVTYCAVEGCMTEGKRTEISRYTYNKGDDSLAHTNLVEQPRVEATCTIPGKTAGAYCADGVEGGCPACVQAGEDYKIEQTVIPATGHDIIITSITDGSFAWNYETMTCVATATCSASGCGAVTETAQVTVIEEKAATCEAAGSVTYQAIFTEKAFGTRTKTEKNGDRLAHDWSGDVVYTYVNAEGVACDGLVEGGKCTATLTCKHGGTDSCVLTETVNVATTKVAATCTTDGYIRYTATFVNNGDKFQTQSRNVDNGTATGHSWEVTREEWNNDYASCTIDMVCENNPAHKHENVTTDDVTADEVKTPTCEDKGETKYTATFGATEDGDVFTVEETIYPDALEHNYGEVTYEWNETDHSTCTATRVCGIDPTHVETETVSTTAGENTATCIEDGYIRYTAVFENEAFGTKTDDVSQEALKHNMKYVDAKAATCKDDGNNAHYKCERCGKLYADEQGNAGYPEALVKIPADGVHKFNDADYVYNNDATCEKDGTMTALCAYGCGTESEPKTDPEHPATKHSYDAGVVSTPATCTEMGQTTYTCQNEWCDVDGGHKETKTDIEPLGHSLIKHAGAESTCDQAGYNAYYQCGEAVSVVDAEGRTYCGAYFAKETDTGADATPIAELGEEETVLKTWLAKPVSEGGGAKELRQCVDADKDHDCDYDDCNKTFGEHKDESAKDHKCDYYGDECTKGTFGEHADAMNDADHLCDYCEEAIGGHEYVEGKCNCGKTEILNVQITITPNKGDIKVLNTEIEYGTALDLNLKDELAAFGDCFEIEDVSVKVDGDKVKCNYDEEAATVSVKGEFITADVEIAVEAKQNHDYEGGEEVIEEKAPTCEETGYFKMEVTCSKCEQVWTTRTITRKALGHKYESEYTAPTFDADGFTTFTCKNDSTHTYTETDEGTKLIAVAKIGDQRYVSLEKAMEAAVEGDTIEMLEGIIVEADQDLNWDLTGITLKIKDVGYDYGLKIRGKLTINGGTFLVDGYYGIGVTADGSLTVNDGTFGVVEGMENWYMIGSWGTTVLNGGTYNGYENCANGFAGSLTVNGGTYTVSITESEYDFGPILAADGVADVKGGNFSIEVDAEDLAEGYCQKLVENVYVVAAHEPGEAQKENNQDADCVNPGSYDLVSYCTRCDKVLDTEHVTVDALGHTVTVQEGLAAKCTADGYREAYYCSVCQKYFATKVSDKELADEITMELSVWQTTDGEKAEGGKIPALPHRTYKVDAKSATCEDAGNNEYYKCYECSNAFKDADGKIPTTDADEIISATNHAYDEGVILEGDEPTCTKEGTRTFTCANDPNHTYTEKVDKLKHDYDYEGGKIVTDPTCTAEGYTTYDCKNCDETHVGDKVPATKHKGIWQAGADRTCTLDGHYGYYKCQNSCGLYYRDQLCTELIGDEADLEEWITIGAGKLPAYGHFINTAVDGKTPDCTNAGYEASFQCDTCKLYFSSKENNGVLIGDGSEDAWKAWALEENGEGYLPATGHTPGEVQIENVVEAKCETDGSHDEVIRCVNDKCNHIISSEHKVDNKLGHQEETVEGKDADCTHTGLTDGIICTRAGCEKKGIIKEQEVIPANGHTKKILPAQEATCTATGLTEGEECSVCHAVLKAQTVVPMKNHVHSVTVSTVLAKCTEDGSQVLKCATCDDTITKVLPATGHNSNGVLEAKAPTCTETGLTAGKECTVCGFDTEPQEVVPALGHTIVETPAVEAKCNAFGYKAYYYCETCQLYFATKVSETELTDKIGDKAALDKWLDTDGQGKIEKLRHTDEVIPAKAPTCTVDGLKSGVKCSVCGDILVAQAKDPAKGHNPVTYKAVDPTCTATGLAEGSRCSVCQEVLVEQEVIPALGHTIEETPAVEAKCDAYGYKAYYYCDTCKGYYTTKVSETELDGKINNIETWKNTLGQGKVEKIPHTEVIDQAVAPTCTETGLTEGKHCSVCDTVIKPQDTIPAKGHTEKIVAKTDPTCTETGLTEGKICSVCDAVLKAQEVVDAKGHTGNLVKGVAAKCELDGWKDYYQCKDCKLFFEDEACTVAIADLTAWRTTGAGLLTKLGHTWDDGRVTTLPDCEKTGVRTFTCETCNGTKTDAEPALGHIPVQQAGQHPTYYTAGWEPYETCDRPGCEHNTMVGIPALGEPSVNTYEDFMASLKLLEEYANAYAKANPGKDPMWLLIKYVRTGVDRYNSGSWNIMAGYEDEAFAEYVKAQEEAYNKAVPTVEDMINVTGIKNIGSFKLPNGQTVDFGHMFGTMDITYHNKTSINHADVSGWAGDLVDLLSTADRHDVTGTVDEMIEEIGTVYLNHHIEGEDDQFGQTDMYGDLDGYYFMKEIIGKDYEAGMLYDLMEDYFVESLTDEQRADYFLKNRLGGVTGRAEIREAVFSEYLGNSVIATLEGTREFKQEDVSDMRKACCYAFADYLCYLAGDYVELGENPYFTVFSTELSTLAPGITQQISKATTADGKQVVYYTATADVKSPYVNVYANYKDNDPSQGWGMQRVMDQANAAQAKYGDPESDQYIENFNVIAAINGAGYNMTTGEPAGVLMMGGVEYHEPSGGFVGFLTDGSCYIGSDAEYYELKEKGLLRDAISMFGTTLVKDGKIAVTATDSYYNDRASRTAIGYTKTGKVVFMVMDGRQEPVSCGGSAIEIAQVMLEAGCVHAINLDGGGSTTYVARQEGDSELSLVSSPSDGFQRSVSTSLYMASTAPSSTAFDHAVLDSEYRYLTIGATTQVTAAGVSATGNPAELPEGATWAVSDTTVASITEDGLVTALANGKVDVNLMLGEEIIGTRTLNVVVPDAVYFTKENMNAIYGEPATLPVAALFEGKPVAITEADAYFTLSNETAGTTSGFTFTGNEGSGIKTLKIYAHAVNNPDATSGSMGINLFRADEASFDFDNVEGGDRLLAYNRVVTNSTTVDSVTYNIIDNDKPMVTEYTFGMDMTQIPMPEKLESLVYMLPGADVEGNNSAWDFLLQLAERVSVLTEVKAVLQLDPNFDVDYSDLSVNCEYFILEKTEFNAETNELTLSLRWKDQTKAIDPDTANPMVILTGFKLTPKADADWGAKERLNIVNIGNISYDIYLRANALYTFASKPENQEAFGLYPFDNQDVIIGGATEKGGHFADTYKTFKDEYTLNKGLLNGWVYENGGYAYYEEGVKYTGIRKVGQFYYDFGSEGINMGQTKYSGLFQQSGINYYSQEGLLTGGWYIDKNDNKYYFDENGKAVDGEYTIDEVKMVFENGLLVGGQTGFIKKTNGNTYYYQNGSMYYGWLELDGKWYCFDETNGIMTVGNGTPDSKLFPTQEAKAKGAYYVFNEQGHALYSFPNNYGYYYWADLQAQNQWVLNGYDLDGIYRTNANAHYVTTSDASQLFQLTLGDNTYTAVKIAIDGVVYTFDNGSGKLLLGSMVYENGQWFYYWAGSPVNDGWFSFEGETYYAYEDGHLATGSATIDGEDYMFTPQGALITEGVMINASLSEDNKTMTVKVLNADEDMTAARMAMWAVKAGQAPTMQWIDLAKQDDYWTAKVSMCTFGLTEEDTFELHVYGTVDEVEALVVNTTVANVAPAEHTYTDAKDPTCDICGFEREIIEEPEDPEKPEDPEQPEQPEEPEKIPTTPMYRLYNPNTGEHFYTGSIEERDMLTAAGWNYEGIAWNAPIYTGAPVHRVFNPNSGDHHYTMSQEEVDMLVELGWQYEGVAWNSAPVDHPESVAQFRLYNPNADIGSHHYTSSTEERDFLVSLGWIYEGIGWFGMLK